MTPSYTLGLFFLLLVSLLWTICSMVVQHLYNDMQFDSPFLIVYIGTSLFSIFLPLRLGYERWGSWMVKHHYCPCFVGDENGGHEVVVIPWRTYDGGEDAQGLVVPPMSSASAASAEETLDDILRSYEPSSRHNNNNSSLLSHQDHISMATKVAPLWFLSNYFYAQSLEWTSIASSTVLASMGSIFAFGFATCSRFGDERITRSKIVGVTLCFLGGVATAMSDLGGTGDISSENEGAGDGTEDLRHMRYLRHPASHLPHISDFTHDSSMLSLLGDLAGLLSAVGYGAYTVLLRHLCPKDEDRMSMQLLFGYIGLLNMTILLPVAIWVIVSSTTEEEQQQPSSTEQEVPPTDQDGATDVVVHTTLTWSIFLFLLLKGLLDNVLSDYLWARAVILTSATVASVGVGLTIPMAFFADWIMGNNTNGGQLGDILGALSVLLGFVFVNLNGEEGRNREEDSSSNYDDGISTIDIVTVADHHSDIIT